MAALSGARYDSGCRTMAGELPGLLRGVWHPCEAGLQLVDITRSLFQNSLAPASRPAYGTGQRHFLEFCRRYRLPVVPASDATPTFFIGHLRRSGLAVASARQYLAAVRRLNLQLGWPMPAELPPYAATALRRGAAENRVRRQALRVQHLRVLKGRLAVSELSTWYRRCVWAACTLGFYGGLRSSESINTGTRTGAQRADMQVTDTNCRLRLRIQKTRQHEPPVHVPVPATGTSTCPVRAMADYCQARGMIQTPDQPLFLLERGRSLSCQRLNDILRHTGRWVLLPLITDRTGNHGSGGRSVGGRSATAGSLD